MRKLEVETNKTKKHKMEFNISGRFWFSNMKIIGSLQEKYRFSINKLHKNLVKCCSMHDDTDLANVIRQL